MTLTLLIPIDPVRGMKRIMDGRARACLPASAWRVVAVPVRAQSSHITSNRIFLMLVQVLI